MNVFIVYAHPEPTSFNRALKEQAIQTLEATGHIVRVSDLYASHFDPVANWNDFKAINPDLPRQYGALQKDAFLNHQLSDAINTEQEKLSWCDVLIFQFPLWWFGLPAILKGWMDKVLSPGFAYDKQKWFADGLLNQKRVMLSLTTQSPPNAYQPDGIHGDINQYVASVYHTFKFVGMTPVNPFVAYGVMDIDLNARKKYLEDFSRHLLKNCHA